MVPTWLVFIAGSWLLLWTADYLLKSSRRTKRTYSALVSCNGLSISAYKVQWYTTRFNGWFAAIGSHRSLQRILGAWFDVGAIFGLISMVTSSCLLTVTLIQHVTKSKASADDSLVTLSPVLPGVNLPSSDLGYFALTLLLCAILHEVGHAVAAIREGMRLNGFGIFVLIVYPGAFVDLNTDSVMASSSWKRLRVFCAGVWHNFVIVLMAAAFLVSMPYLLSPFYSRGAGATVAWTVASVPDATAFDERHATDLMPGDVVVAVDNCTVLGRSEWSECIGHASAAPAVGYCVHPDSFPDAYVAGGEGHSSDYCCPENSSSHVCFKFYSDGSVANELHSDASRLRCLRARAVSSAPTFCRIDADCAAAAAGHRCAVPYLGADSGGGGAQRLMKVARGGGLQPVLFLGQPLELHASVVMTDFRPRGPAYPLYLPLVLERLCQYIVSLSSALALLNVVPCYALDGHWILEAAVELLLRERVPSAEARAAVSSVCLLLGSLLLAGNLMAAMSSVVF